LLLAKAGHPSLPLQHGGVDLWPGLTLADASADRFLVIQAHRSRASANLGLRLDGLLALSAIGQWGEQALAALQAQHEVVFTRTAARPDGGRDLLYALPSDVTVATSDVVLGDGLTVRAGASQYLVVAPSRLGTRRMLACFDERPAWRWQVPEWHINAAPDWLLDLVAEEVAA
jgi:hypothetical protein